MTGKRKKSPQNSPVRPKRRHATGSPRNDHTTADDGQVGQSVSVPVAVDRKVERLESLVDAVFTCYTEVFKQEGCDLPNILFERFRNKRLELNTYKKLPETLWVVTNNVHPGTEYTIRPTMDVDDVIPPAFKKKWMNVEDTEKQILLQCVKKTISHYTTDVVFDGKMKTWVRRERNETDVREESAKADDAGDGEVQENGQGKTSGEGDSEIQENVKGKNSGKELELKQKISDIPEHFFTCIVFFAHEFSRKLIMALLHRMMNSKGREFCSSLLECASHVCFGLFHPINVMPVGSSGYKCEGFPVTMRASRCHRQSDASYDSPSSSSNTTASPRSSTPASVKIMSPFPGSHDAGHAMNMQSTTQYGHHMSPVQNMLFSQAVNQPPTQCSSQSIDQPVTPLMKKRTKSQASSSEKFSGNMIFPDCVVACKDKSNFSKYIIICEVKGNANFAISQEDLCQLLREMLGGCTNQTEVFGIYINICQCAIVRMCVHETSKLVTYGIRYYHFTCSTFEVDTFFKFFCDVLAVLDYGYTHISQVK